MQEMKNLKKKRFLKKVFVFTTTMSQKECAVHLILIVDKDSINYNIIYCGSI